MDLEQLTLILKTIQSMGGDAKEFGIWWMVCSTLPKVISSILLFCFGCLLIRLMYLISKVISADCLRDKKYQTDKEMEWKREFNILPKENH